MPKVWGTEKAENATCTQCGAVYSVELKRVPMRESDYFNCQVCNHEMNRWNGTTFPSYTLISQPEASENDT